ncbi:DENN domain-containing protein 1B-like isoform X2 [Pseudophryne corroboree]|uniref:DENN domain-containing protein 1B-like isoform X2 n=1 Tax=Pseudophryne corroboree TaxID=495146 RepID=UPI0030818CE7
MGSRIKENPERIFEGYFEVLCPTSLDKDPVLKRQFPEHFDDQDSVTTLTKFCFPFHVERWQNSSVQHFSFTLTDLQGFQRFGFCRLSVQAKICTCILSCLPWFEFFYKLLNNIAEYLVKDQVTEVTDVLQSLYDHPVPEVNQALDLEMFSYFTAPNPAKLPSIPENRNLTEFLVAVQVDTMLQLYASLLCERRILITSSKLSTLTACVHASAALLYPMYWQHIYIPTLPPHLLDYCSAPMPYLIGVHSSLMEQVTTGALEGVVVFNMDTNNLETPFEDLDNLPPHVVSLLRLRLTKQSAFMGDRVSYAFLGAQALLFGSYRDALICSPGEPLSFCQETFLKHKSSSMRNFLQNAVHLQLFTQFIDSRLEKLNSGEEFTDVFEQEVTTRGLSGGSKSYQMWLENLKKGGGTLINNMKNRTHPTVKNMLRYAKGQAKTGLQGMKRRIKPKPRPKRPGKPYVEENTWECQRDVEGTCEEKDPESTEQMEFPLLDDGMDLLNEIFETLNTRTPGEKCALYGAHSLDCFHLEDSQYFNQFHSINSPSDENLSLSLSQPRNSDLWYLQEEDEGSLDCLESLESLSTVAEDISNTSDTTEVKSLENKSSIQEDSFQAVEDTELTSEVTFQTPEVSIPEIITATSPEVISIALKRTLQEPKVTTEQNATTPTPEPEILPPLKEAEKQKNLLSAVPTLTNKDTGDTSHTVSGPFVRAALSHFQAGPLDPRLVWTGTKRDSTESPRAGYSLRSFNTQRPISQTYCTPKPNTQTHSIRPPFLRTQSTPKLETQSSPTSAIPKLSTQLHDTTSATPNRTNADQGNLLPPQPADWSLPTKVSELKKKFEA